MHQEISDIVEGILEDDSHTNTCLLGKVWRTLDLDDYSAIVLGFHMTFDNWSCQYWMLISL